MSDANTYERIALIAELVRRAPARPGRTALMKFLFFLKALRDVPSPYNFRLYTYGPFDDDVLDDLKFAESLEAVRSTLVSYPRGYGYEYQPGGEIEEFTKSAQDFLTRHGSDIDWVLGTFGRRSAVDLEMASTLIYIDRNYAPKGEKQTLDELVKQAHDVKPHLSQDAIGKEARSLQAKNLLVAVA